MFFEYYPRLLEWATQITRNDRAEAEDLVHDFYLRVTRITRPIDEIELRDQYLFTILRNLYYAQLRRAGHDPINDLSIVDYDSVEQGLAAADRRSLLYVRDHLRKVCRYACERKCAVRSASVLILRFFHGYYPTELIKILKTSRSSVDKLLKVARAEARLYLERPEAIRCISSSGRAPVSFPGKSESSTELFSELQEAIFTATDGKCFDRSELERLYVTEIDAAGPTTRELSHLVSCHMCLESVNEILQLPSLAERSPENGIDRDGPGSEGGSGVSEMRKRPSKKGAGKGPDTRKLERRARDLFEHRPDKLQVAVDGEMRASQKVSAETNELHLKLARKETPSFIEVLSEQGFCLAYLQVGDPAPSDQLEQVETVSLSDNRSLTVTFTFAADVPIIHVLYVDPVMAEDAATDFKEETSVPALPKLTVDLTVRPFGQPARQPQRWLRRRAESMWTWVQTRYEAFLSFMNPMLATAMVCAVAAVVFLVLSFRASSVMKPEELIGKAATTENAPIQSGETGVIVQSVRIQTPHRKIERTLYRDLQGRRRAKSQEPSREDAALSAELENAGVSWNDPLSADSFRDWHDRASVSRDVVKRADKGLLTLTTTVETGRVASESLTVREADFHTVGRRIELRNAEIIEIAELNYSVLPWSSVNPNLFEPLGAGPSAIDGNTHAPLLPHIPESLSPLQIDEAELGARLVLNRLHMDASGRIGLTRAANGIHVQGVVETDEEKHELQTQLYMLPHVFPSIQTVREMAAKPDGGSEVTSIRESSVTVAGPSALDRYFMARGADRIASSASTRELVESSFAIKHESEQIAGLLERFSANKRLSDEARRSLSELLIQHKAALLAALGREERQLVSAQLIPRPITEGNVSDGDRDALRESAEQNFSLCADLISGSEAPSRSAQTTAPQLANSIAQLRAVVLHISAAAQLHPPSSASASTAYQKK